jgi:hypothetical protein
MPYVTIVNPASKSEPCFTIKCCEEILRPLKSLNQFTYEFNAENVKHMTGETLEASRIAAHLSADKELSRYKPSLKIRKGCPEEHYVFYIQPTKDKQFI